MNETLFVEIKIALKRRGITQSDLARELGVDRGYISKILTGKYKSERMLAKMKDVLNINL